MSLLNDERIYSFIALTPIWTGSVSFQSERHGSQQRDSFVNSRLISTGLLGSIRWWFEVLVRGMGGCACDPTDTDCTGAHHCVVCELFGCTGWARKFRFQVLKNGDNAIRTDPIEKGDSFAFQFLPLRPVRAEEWALLSATLRLIARFGAIGGKTVLKPADTPNKQSKQQHKDYGLVKLISSRSGGEISLKRKSDYLRSARWRKVDQRKFSWASLEHFWCVQGGYLTRSACKKVFSKQVFSFCHPPRTFGFVNPNLIDLKHMKGRPEDNWKGRDWKFLQKDDILRELFAE